MGSIKKKDRKYRGDDKFVGAVVGIVICSVASAVLIGLLNDGFPYGGYLGVAIAAFPGVIVGAILGFMFPRIFNLLGNGF